MRHPISRQYLIDNFYYCPETGVIINLQKYARPIQGTQVMIEGRNYYVHRLAWLWVTGKWPVGQVDHINRNPRDNRICNLREASDAENKQNCGISRKGYTKHGRKYRVKVATNGVGTYMGSFDTPEEAHAKYLEVKKQVHPFFVEVA